VAKRVKTAMGRWGPRHPHLSRWGGRAVLPVMDRFLSHHGIHRPGSELGCSSLTALRQTIHDGREAYVLGFGTTSHNTGAALVRISEQGQVHIVCNEEEERYTAIKHCDQYPVNAVEAVKRHMRTLGIEPADLAACVSSWDFAASFNVACVHPMLEEAPASLTVLLRERAEVERMRQAPGSGMSDNGDSREHTSSLIHASKRLGHQLGLERSLPIIGSRHHDNHAYLSFAVSPFAASPDPTMVVVIDGAGDDSTASLYVHRDGQLTLLHAPGSSRYDSLGAMYGFLSSAEGGWSQGSSEGRYMGAAAWGDGNRLTNPYYRRMKHLFHFDSDGEVYLNRALANWTRASFAEPYSQELVEILGEPIPPDALWDPDAVLDVEDVEHPEVTRDRVDKAAAVQMLFEDALVHIVDHVIRTTRSHRLVLTGGTALNCVANMRLLECFDEAWYERNLGLANTRLHLWVPPIPGDAGTPVGAAYAFAMRAGARPGPPLKHAFYCGHPPSTPAIRAAIDAEPTAASISLGDCSEPDAMAQVTDLLAHLVANDRIIGLYQGVAETGPRALGHRSILANPCNPDTRRLLNERVKHRELIRPLAPMLTRTAAERFFYLEQGACDDDYNAYNYMVFTAHARPEAFETIPSVIHHDGTGRIQIVRPDTDPFCHEYLLAMERKVGVAASVNTSLNVGAPIAHTPEQAIATLKRARGMDGLLMIGDDQTATLTWLDDRTDARERLMQTIQTWITQAGNTLPNLSNGPIREPASQPLPG
jgi:carbamoyltransferase